jgi:hypothetical protein
MQRLRRSFPAEALSMSSHVRTLTRGLNGRGGRGASAPNMEVLRWLHRWSVKYHNRSCRGTQPSQQGCRSCLDRCFATSPIRSIQRSVCKLEANEPWTVVGRAMVEFNHRFAERCAAIIKERHMAARIRTGIANPVLKFPAEILV